MWAVERIEEMCFQNRALYISYNKGKMELKAVGDVVCHEVNNYHKVCWSFYVSGDFK